jgi:hypothetical protein
MITIFLLIVPNIALTNVMMIHGQDCVLKAEAVCRATKI